MMQRTITILFLFVFFGCSQMVNGQELLTMEQALQIALENNLGIKIAQNNIQISENSVSKGNAGLLPQVNLNGGIDYNLNSGNIAFVPEVFPRPDLAFSFEPSNNINASATATYTLFDGWASITNYKVLQSNLNISEMQARLTIENTLIQVVNAYYQAAQQQENVKIAGEQITISKDRLERAKTRNEFGGNNTLDVLNAEVDLNTDSVNLVTNILNFENAKRNLNNLLNRSLTADFLLEERVAFLTDVSLEDLRDKVLNQNTEVRLANQNLEIAKLDLKSARSGFYPTVNASASYLWATSQFKAQGTQRSTTGTITGGLTVSYPLFEGGRRNIQRQNATIAIENRLLEQQQTKELLERDLEIAFANYENSRYILRIEQTNIKSAEANFERSKANFDVGQINNTQFREAQFNLANARTRIANAIYTAKIAEMELIRLSGDLVN
ncbi:MAG: TolC family protein [Bacteroidota bacterium]